MMIITKLMGGMGNQMFQYAFARKISILDNRELKMDLSFLNLRGSQYGHIMRDYDLDLFNIKEDFITEYNATKINETNVSKGGEHWTKFQDSVSNCYKTNKNNIHLEGYWQSAKYFDEIGDIIKKEFTLKNKISEKSQTLLKEIKSKNSVMINIRRTDYLNNNYHGVMGADFVYKGMNIIESKIKNPYYYIFSDDIEWCKENLKIENSMIVDHEYAGDRFGEYLELMKNCKHFIIPNSSFAWWAAWLSKEKDKIVIYPNKWYVNKHTNITTGLDWIGI